MSLSASNNSLIDEVVIIARSLSDTQIKQFVVALSNGDISLLSGVLQTQHTLHLSTTEARNVATLLYHWQREGKSSENLVTALLAAHMAYVRTQEEAPSVRLVWTGPINTAVPARSTSGVLLDLIDRAEREIVIVGYVLTEAASIVFEHLAAAQKRGISVTLIGNRMEEKLSVLRVCWPTNQRLPALYSRMGTPDDTMSALHAKLAIVDRQYMLVTSANLTYHGLTGNIEIGVEVEGKTATDAAELLNRLIADNVCVRIYDC